MKKKLFLVLCSCFAGALALSSCGGGGGSSNRNLSEWLAPFVNGNFSILYKGAGDSNVEVVGRGQFTSAEIQENQVTANTVLINYAPYGSTQGSETGYADYTIVFQDNKPARMMVHLYGLSETEVDNTLPFTAPDTVISMSPHATLGFGLGATGTAQDSVGTNVNYEIITASY
ncbi:MAG: hypothetical protein PUD60_03150 [Akkermansia muciniphila]|nr:hypothetical protein [Akkermansia muciniphila]